MKKLACQALCINLLFLSPCLWAFNSHLKFRTIDEIELDRIYTPNYVDSEYSSDLLTYISSLQSDLRWLRNNRALYIGTGSLGTDEFFQERALKIKTPVTQRLNFEFIYHDYGDWEDEFSSVNIAFSYRLNKIEYSVFGESFHEKKKDDIGASIKYFHSEDYFTEFFHTWPDFDRGFRNRENDFFSNVPITYGLYGLWLKESDQGQFVDYLIKMEPAMRWSFPDSGRTYDYRKKIFSSRGIIDIDKDDQLEFRILLEDKFERDSQSQTLERQRSLNVIRWNWKSNLTENWLKPSWGLGYQQRNWTVDGQWVGTQDIQPHFMVYRPQRKRKYGYSQWRAGYEITFHNVYGDLSLMPLSQNKTYRAEHRANLWWDWHFNPQSTLSFAFTFDMDRFGHPDTWEGGWGSLSAVF